MTQQTYDMGVAEGRRLGHQDIELTLLRQIEVFQDVPAQTLYLSGVKRVLRVLRSVFPDISK